MPEVGIPSLLQDKLTDTGGKPRGILRWRSQVIISGVSHYHFLKCFRTFVPFVNSPFRFAPKFIAKPLFVMSPHSNDLDGPYFIQDLVDEAVLDIDAT